MAPSLPIALANSPPASIPPAVLGRPTGNVTLREVPRRARGAGVRAIAFTRPRSTVLSGISSVGSGVLGAGVFTYLFLSLAGRVLGPAGFAPLSTLWALVFIVGPGLFLPVQQELGRVIAGQRGERGGARAARKVQVIAAAMAVMVGVAALVAGDWLTRELFDGQWALLWCFEGAVVAYAVSFTARGIFSGLGDFKDFGRLVAAESVVRLAIGLRWCWWGFTRQRHSESPSLQHPSCPRCS